MEHKKTHLTFFYFFFFTFYIVTIFIACFNSLNLTFFPEILEFLTKSLIFPRYFAESKIPGLFPDRWTTRDIRSKIFKCWIESVSENSVKYGEHLFNKR